jgi:hypothetical protein
MPGGILDEAEDADEAEPPAHPESASATQAIDRWSMIFFICWVFGGLKKSAERMSVFDKRLSAGRQFFFPLHRMVLA